MVEKTSIEPQLLQNRVVDAFWELLQLSPEEKECKETATNSKKMEFPEGITLK